MSNPFLRLDPDQNIEDMYRPQKKKHTWHSLHKENRHWTEKTIGFVLVIFGSVGSVIFHSIWFFGWFKFNLNIDLLTLVVSLEAIYIGILMLIDGREKDKQSAAQAAHFTETMDRIEAKIDQLINEKN